MDTSRRSSSSIDAIRRRQFESRSFPHFSPTANGNANRRYMQLEGLQTVSDAVPTRLSAVTR
jgi:hypothetical protein